MTTVILFGFGYYNYHERSVTASKELSDSAQRVAGRLAKSTAQAIWGMDTKQAQEALLSEMGEKQVQSLVIREQDGVKIFAAKGRDASWNAVDITETPADAQAISAKATIERQGAAIGFIEVNFTQKFVQGELRQMLWASAISTLIVDAAVVAILFLVITMIVIRPLTAMQGYAQEVGSGNLACQAMAGYFLGELGALKTHLETMVCNLSANLEAVRQKSLEAAESARQADEARLVAEQALKQAEKAKQEGMLQAAQQLEGVVVIVSSASEELSAQIEESSRGSEEQSSRIGDTAAAITEMSSTVLEVAKNAAQAAETADLARHKAIDGANIVDQVVQGIGEVQKQAVALKEDMNALGQQAQSIGQVMNVISDIADQTNLLALNAAIEAARAGDAGRGFAVVADEVRKLAEKTMLATKEVGNAIRGIQDSAHKSIANVDETATLITSSTGMAAKSGEALKEIVSLVDTTTDQVRQIATASEEQSAASEEISHSIEDVNRLSIETADAMRQSAEAVGKMAEQAQILRRLIEQMEEEGGMERKSPSAAVAPRPLAAPKPLATVKQPAGQAEASRAKTGSARR
ncbi:MAG: methyl-accepting chemotaxis protein [Humidesulfovibrio sp.]|nr:methyl-accepting chemotaxis protein [Humidesulfovibrio sp.]